MFTFFLCFFLPIIPFWMVMPPTNLLAIFYVHALLLPGRSLKIIIPHKLIGRGTFKKDDFVGISMALLEEVHHCEDGL